MTAPQIRVEAAAFDQGAELNRFTSAAAPAGAVVSFSGTVRDEGGILEALEIEHYPAMTAVAIQAIAEEAARRWSLTATLVIHRFGRLVPGEAIMMVATAAQHRREAFEAAEFLMDYLKSRAPFWKKAFTAGGAEWVAAKDSDEDALGRWG